MIKRSRPESTLGASVSCATDPASEARQILGSSGYHALRLLRCEYHEGAVVIHGLVPSFYQKQLAQAVLLADPRITAVINRAEVIHESLREHADLPIV